MSSSLLDMPGMRGGGYHLSARDAGDAWRCLSR